MLTKKSLKLLGQVFSMCHTIRVIPYQWDLKLLKLIPAKSSLIPCYINILNIYIYAVYLIMRTSDLKNIVSPFKTTVIVVHLLYAVNCSMMAFIGTVLFLLKEDTQMFFNDYTEFYMDFGDKYFPKPKKGSPPEKTSTDLFLTLVSRFMPILGIVNLIPFLKYNRHPFCIYSLILPYVGKSYFLIIAFAVYQSWIITTMVFLGMFYMSVTVTQCLINLEIIKHIKVKKEIEGDKKRYPTPDEIPSILRQLQLIANELDHCISSKTVPIVIGCMMTLNIMGNYCTITLPLSKRAIEKTVMTYFSLFTISFNTGIFILGGMLFKLSTAMLRSWRIRPGNSPYLKKLLKSCRPQKLKVGMFYFIRLNNTLTLANRIINYTGKVLIWTGFGK